MVVKNRNLTKTDPGAPYVPYHVGTFVTNYETGGKTRRMITYIPEGVKASTSGIYLFPPSGVTAEEFLESSNWAELADTEEHREKMVLFVFEAAEGGQWDIDEPYDAKGGDQEYLWKAFEDSLGRELCCVYEGKRYVVGYREGGTTATKFAMWNPADIGGIVTVDALPVPQHYMEQAAKDLCPRLHNFVDKKCVRGIVKGEIPMPAWFISSEDMRDCPEVSYWRNANLAEEMPRMVEMDTWEYYRTRELEHPLDGELEGYRVWVTKTEGASEDYGYLWNRSIWKKFLYPVIRWAANPGGSLRMAKDPVYDLGMNYHYESVEGWMREWYVHIPEQIKCQQNEKVPLVFVPHGYSCTGELCVGNADWYKVGEKYGFITIYPTALYGSIQGDSNLPEGGVKDNNCPLPAWNIYDIPGHPSELNFFLHMLEDVCRSYPVDRSRVFITGTSMGNLMTQYMVLKRPDIFAAAAPTSGILHMAGGESMLEQAEVKNRPRVDIPIWMFGGEMEDWLLDAVPTAGNRTGKTIRTWWELNCMPGEIPENFGKSKKVMGRWNDWTYEKEGIPMVKFTGIDYYPHATNPEMSYRIWEEFFSKFRRGEDGAVIYEGQ